MPGDRSVTEPFSITRAALHQVEQEETRAAGRCPVPSALGYGPAGRSTGDGAKSAEHGPYRMQRSVVGEIDHFPSS